jgi:hypothetical protein
MRTAAYHAANVAFVNVMNCINLPLPLGQQAALAGAMALVDLLYGLPYKACSMQPRAPRWRAPCSATACQPTAA